MSKPVVVTLERFGSQCPTQWGARTEDGREIYIRYRNGRLKAGFDSGEWWTWFIDRQVGETGDGHMTTDDMMRHTEQAIDWSKLRVYMGSKETE